MPAFARTRGSIGRGPSQVARWARRNHCEPTPVDSVVAPDVTRRVYIGCGDNAAVELYTVHGGGHAWPGKPVPQFEKSFGHGTTDIDASALIFSFFFDLHPS